MLKLKKSGGSEQTYSLTAGGEPYVITDVLVGKTLSSVYEYVTVYRENGTDVAEELTNYKLNQEINNIEVTIEAPAGTFELNLPAKLQTAIAQANATTQEVTCYPYLDSSYASQITELQSGITGETITEVILKQGENTWTFNNLSVSNGIITMINNDNTVTVSIDTTEAADGYIWINDSDIELNKYHNPGHEQTMYIVLANPASSTDFNTLMALSSPVSDVYLAQEDLHTGYVCGFTASESGEAASITFDYIEGEEEGTLIINLISENNSWVYQSVSQHDGFDDIVIS